MSMRSYLSGSFARSIVLVMLRLPAAHPLPCLCYGYIYYHVMTIIQFTIKFSANKKITLVTEDGDSSDAGTHIGVLPGKRTFLLVHGTSRAILRSKQRC